MSQDNIDYGASSQNYSEASRPQNVNDGGGNRGDFLLGMLVGAAVGAAVALLYAPSSGQDTRGQLRTAAEDVRGRAGEVTSTLRDRGADIASQVRDRASNVASTVSSSVQDLTSKGKEMAQGATGGGGDLPDTDAGHKTGHRDEHELQVSDDAEVVADRINNAMQGSGEEAHEIAEQLAQAPTSRRDETL